MVCLTFYQEFRIPLGIPPLFTGDAVAGVRVFVTKSLIVLMHI